jgi:hypothetical protein
VSTWTSFRIACWRHLRLWSRNSNKNMSPTANAPQFTIRKHKWTNARYLKLSRLARRRSLSTRMSGKWVDLEKNITFSPFQVCKVNALRNRTLSSKIQKNPILWIRKRPRTSLHQSSKFLARKPIKKTSLLSDNEILHIYCSLFILKYTQISFYTQKMTNYTRQSSLFWVLFDKNILDPEGI